MFELVVFKTNDGAKVRVDEVGGTIAVVTVDTTKIAIDLVIEILKAKGMNY